MLIAAAPSNTAGYHHLALQLLRENLLTSYNNWKIISRQWSRHWSNWKPYNGPQRGCHQWLIDSWWYIRCKSDQYHWHSTDMYGWTTFKHHNWKIFLVAACVLFSLLGHKQVTMTYQTSPTIFLMIYYYLWYTYSGTHINLPIFFKFVFLIFWNHTNNFC